MYINKLLIAGRYVLVKNYTPKRFGAPGRRRRKRKMETPEAMARYNDRKRAEKIQMLMLLNFENGYHVILDYPKDKRPEKYEEAEDNLRKCLYKISRRLKRSEKKFKYLAITERGKIREALHHHLIIESDPEILKELTDIWGNHIKFAQMYEEGAYKDLADYFCKIETKEEQTKGKSKYHRSRNLKEPTVKSRIVSGPLKEDPVIPKGYEIVPESVVNGFNDFSRIRFQKYMIKKSADENKKTIPQKRRSVEVFKRESFWESFKKKVKRKILRKEKRHG
ncbi:MAG: hypothetical protein J6S67_04495 [Methanobrevibacter sp.]|nr:hypothetical protein [Methanobrevibacter sp.]